jgi:hypothetical protein
MATKACLISVAALVALILLELRASSADQRARNRPTAKYVVYAAPKEPSWGPELLRILRGKYGAASAVEADGIEKAIASTAEVLILVLPEGAPPRLSSKTLEALKKRKIIGIGEGAAAIFGQIGLEIEPELCASNRGSRLSVTKSILFDDQKRVEKDTVTGAARRALEPHSQGQMEIQVEAPGSAPVPGSQVQRNIAIYVIGDPNKANAAETSRRVLSALDHAGSIEMFVPPWSPYSAIVDVIARSADEPLYAPIVRQGNCVMIGLTVPPARWSHPYTEFFCQLCQRLLERKRERFATARWPVTPAGKYEFKLADARQTERPFDKTFFLELKAPTTFTARLTCKGSKTASMVFSGNDRAHWKRSDCDNGGAASQLPSRALEISETLDRNDIDRMEGHYWKLNVDNYDEDTSAECTLTIQYAIPTK